MPAPDTAWSLLDRFPVEQGALAGRTALITGGGRGIGREVAGLLSRLGANVVLADIREEVEDVAASIREAGGSALSIRCDLADPTEVDRLVDEVSEAHGHVDILVNGAMTMVVAPIAAMSVEDWDRSFAVNLRAAFLTIRALLPGMAERGHGVVVNMIAYEGSPLTSAYAATKVGLRSLALTAAREVGPDAGVSVFAFVPGIVDSPVVRETLIPAFSAALDMPPEQLETTVLAQNPGYAGLMPIEHCAAALAYTIVHAPEYHGQVADPFEPLGRFGVIQLPSVEDAPSLALTVEASLPQHLKQYLSGVTEQNRELEARIDLRTRELAEEHARSERLLLNILPQPIADRLKSEERTIADSFEDVTVLFADIVDFTPFAARLEPKDVVDVLDSVFSMLDDIAGSHGLEKIKTIGDCYMLVGGLPEPRIDHAEAVADAAIEIREQVKIRAGDSGEPLSLRIGLHSGPVVAGVIGRRKFIYDLWGDTVNTASRMESQGRPDAIHCSASAFELLRDDFLFEPRGTIDVKGKGPMETYFLLGRNGGEAS
jgi:adenylate cyclase